jgi:hypothetical protein
MVIVATFVPLEAKPGKEPEVEKFPTYRSSNTRIFCRSRVDDACVPQAAFRASVLQTNTFTLVAKRPVPPLICSDSLGQLGLVTEFCFMASLHTSPYCWRPRSRGGPAEFSRQVKRCFRTFPCSRNTLRIHGPRRKANLS